MNHIDFGNRFDSKIEVPETSRGLSQFVNSAESSDGQMVVDIIKQALEAQSVYVFSELLNVTSVQGLSGTSNEEYLNLLKIFAYGTYSDYVKQRRDKPNSLPEMTQVMSCKLRQLSIITLARSRRNIPYKLLLEELGVNTIRELEDIIIDAIYANVIKGTMDQKNSQLEIDQTIGRDVREQDFQIITNVLNEWSRNCDNILSNIEHQMSSANQVKEETIKNFELIENKVASIRKTLKFSVDNEDTIITDVNNVYARDNSDVKFTKRNATSKVQKNTLSKAWRKNE